MGNIFSALYSTLKALRSAVSLLKTLSNDFDQALKRASQPPGLPSPAPTQSYWLAEPPFPELVDVCSSELPTTADVAIIGSGITGAAIARSLLHEQRRRCIDTDMKVVVLEARELSSGATARNGGHIKPAPYEVFTRFCKNVTRDRAAALVRFQMRHIDCLVKLCQEENIEAAEARNVETVDLFLDDLAFQKALEDVEKMKEWLPEIKITVWDKQGAQKVLNPPLTITIFVQC